MRRLALITGAVLLILSMGVAQLVLPGVAARRLRNELARHGRVRSVHVSAFPAIELLWHEADRVEVRMTSYAADTGTLANSLGQAGQAGSLDAAATTVVAGLLTLHDARLQKRGSTLTGSAEVRLADLRRAFPFLTDLHPVSAPGGPLVLRGTASLLGVSATADATVTAQGGRIVVTPQVPFGGLATFSVFSSPRVAVDAVWAAPSAAGFALSARGHLR